jgi:hypothetical protein
MATPSTPHRLLRDHFLRRFLDNDLLSAHTDRHDTLVLVATALVVPGLVITVLLIGSKYLFGIPTPALTAVASLDDKFLYISVSMLVMVLIAAVQWDALSLDARDTAILGPLPVTAQTIGRAKLAALVMFVAAFSIALNLAPSVVFPLLLVSHFHVNIVAVVRMILVHAAVTMAAGAWAFMAVLVVRETIRLCTSAAWFRRISVIVQVGLIIASGSALLLIPWIATGVAATYLQAPLTRAVPPAWFVGLYEAGTRGITLTIRGLNLRIPRMLVEPEHHAHDVYDALLPRFTSLAEGAAVVLIGTTVLALALYTWNNRRLPAPALAGVRRRTDLARLLATGVTRSIVRHPIERAGFFFTLQAMTRSAPHRMSIAASAAVAFAASVLFLHGIKPIGGAALATTRLLALQTIVIAIVLVGIRRALAMPAELRANWIFPINWGGDVARFVSGVRRAIVVGCIAPLIIAMTLFDVYLIGVGMAIRHAAVGWVLALLMLELLLRNADRLPLTCSERPLGNLKAFAPIYLMVLFVAAYNVAAIERAAMRDGMELALLVAAIASICIAFRLWDARYHAAVAPIAFDDLPEAPTQRLGLSEPV